MNRRIVIWLGFLTFGLTIVGITADGETTPTASAIVSQPEAVKLAEADAADDKFKCYEYTCGKNIVDFNTGEKTTRECPTDFADIKTTECHAGKTKCQYHVFKGDYGGKPVDYIAGSCASPRNEDACADIAASLTTFSGKAETCYCSTALCNKAPVTDTDASSITSSSAFVTITALGIAVRMMIF